MRRKIQDRAARNERRDALAAVAERFKGFRPAREILKEVRAVPTVFVQFDHATKVGGLPIERFMLMHGPSNEGKTAFSLGLLKSFLMRDHFAMLIDAERTTPITWAREMMGEYADHPGFYAIRPDSYEDAVEKVRGWLEMINKLREEGKVARDTFAIIIVDSIRKLVPKGILANISKVTKEDGNKGKKPKGVDGVGGRAGQIKAAMNAAWMDELIPLLEKSQAAFIAIARESEDPDADAWSRKFGNAYKIGGGKAIFYDASLAMRIERASYVTDKKGIEEKERPKVYGERHRVTIRKTKVGGREEKQTQCYFYTSNGVLIPPGFDSVRDALEIGENFGIVKRTKGWLTWKRNRWQTRGGQAHNAVRKLAGEPQSLAELEREIRAMFDEQKPVEFESDDES